MAKTFRDMNLMVEGALPTVPETKLPAHHSRSEKLFLNSNANYELESRPTAAVPISIDFGGYRARSKVRTRGCPPPCPSRTATGRLGGE
jgi:hypothetical protein